MGGTPPASSRPAGLQQRRRERRGTDIPQLGGRKRTSPVAGKGRTATPLSRCPRRPILRPGVRGSRSAGFRLFRLPQSAMARGDLGRRNDRIGRLGVRLPPAAKAKAVTAGRDHFIRQLEDAADRIADISRHELQILLRRAALRLRNLPAPENVDREVQEFLDEITGHDPRSP